MLFHTQLFLLVFLPLVLAGYYLGAHHRAFRSWLLIVASLVFYGYWDLRLLPLLVGSIVVNWLFARYYQRIGGGLLVPLGVTLNLVVLGVFKYADFFGDTLALLSGSVHERWSIILPLGISFYTFQQISYLIDLKRGKAPLYTFTEYALYVSFFPQLIAGPIVRHREIIFQYARDPLRAGLYERLSKGLLLLLFGLFKKSGLADHMADVADPLFQSAASGTLLSVAESWTATAAFGLEIYFDFSGYSDMAIGLALLFGLGLPINFDAPYRADSIRDFWRRWHMTLSRFLRDYLYFPLGGSRHGPGREITALMVTMFLGGLWHGAAWTFVVWGGLHGAALAVNHSWARAGLALPLPLSRLLTLLFVTLAWVLFRAADFATAWNIYTSMFAIAEVPLTVAKNYEGEPWLIAVAAAFALLGPTSQRLALELIRPRLLVAVGVGWSFAVMVLAVGGWQGREFIYFQF